MSHSSSIMKSVSVENAKENGSATSSGGVSSMPPMSFLCDKEPGIKFAAENGFYGPGKSHILTYDPSQIRP